MQNKSSNLNKDCVGIIMPVWNSELYLQNSLLGILNQKHTNWKLFITDDFSTDNSLNIIYNFINEHDLHGKIIVIKPRYLKGHLPGPSYPRNSALNKANHDPEINYIAYCDSDDVWLTDHLSSALLVLENDEADMTYSDCRFVDSQGNQMRSYGIPYYEQFDKENLKKGNFIFISTVVHRKKCLSVGYFDTELKNHEDYDMWLRISNEYQVKHVIYDTVNYLVKPFSTYYNQEESNFYFNQVKLKHNFILPDGWFDDIDIRNYRRMFESLPDEAVVCELGVWHGRSICSVADIIIRKKITVHCVDTFQGTPSETVYNIVDEASNYSIFYNNITYFKLDKTKFYIYQNTTDAAFLQFKEQGIKFDLVFIDADHSEEASTKDIGNYMSLLKDQNSILAGHDYTWETIRASLNKFPNVIDKLSYEYNIWWSTPLLTHIVLLTDNQSNLLARHDYFDVTAVICTKDRYDYLYQTLLCVALQKHKPEYLLVYDDSDNKENLQEQTKWLFLFTLLDKSGIKWEFILTDKHGQNKNHQLSIEKATTKYIWRVDDDLIFDEYVLEKYIEILKANANAITDEGVYDNIGAIGCQVITPNNYFDFDICSSKLEDINTKPNIQMAVNNSGLHKVEHLHCSFIYDRTVGVSYHPDLSRVGHREETIFTHRLFKQGLTLLVDLNNTVYHLKANNGGIRSEGVTNEMFEHDEQIFIKEFFIKPSMRLEDLQYNKFIYLDNGLGDHVLFLPILNKLLELNEDKILIACCFPELFFEYKNNPRVILTSINIGKEILVRRNEIPEQYSIYHYANLNNFQDKVVHIKQAYEEIYLSKHNIKYSIIIGTYNHLEDCLIPCLESIFKYTKMDDKEIIIVANGCTDNTVEYLSQKYKNESNVVCVNFPEALGYPKAYNIGIKQARGEFIILLNNDTILLEQEQDNWIKKLQEPFYVLLDNVGITGPLKLWNEELQFDFVVFFCTMIHKKVFEKIGYLDINFKEGSSEDIDFCYRAIENGFAIFQAPYTDPVALKDKVMVGNFPIYHKGEGTVHDIPNWSEIFENNKKLLKIKHGK